MGRKLRTIPLCGVVLLGLVLVAGCGSSGDSSTNGREATGGDPAAVAKIEKKVDALERRPAELPETEPIKGAVPKGKTIDYMQCGVPACVKLAGYFEEAAEAVGWKVNVVDIGLTPEEVKAGFEQAVRDHPDAVVTTGGYERAVYGAELKQLKADGIPVIGHSEAVPPSPQEGVVAVESGPARHEEIGKAWADWIVAESEGDAAKVLFIDTGFPVQGVEREALEAELARTCDDCSFSSYQAPLSSIGNDLAGRIAQQMQKAPEAEYLMIGYGDMATGVPAALAGAGIGSVKIGTQEQADATIEDMRDGKVSMFFIGAGPESMWEITDTLIRYFNHEPYPKEPQLPSWIVTASTVPEGLDWPAVPNYKAEFEKRWGV